MAKSVFQHHKELLQHLLQHLSTTPPFYLETLDTEEEQTLRNIETLASASNATEDYFILGQETLCKIIGHYHAVTPHIHRDLLWYFGGICLHFMPDEEIARYQRLDDHCQALEEQGVEINYEDERAKIFGLH